MKYSLALISALAAVSLAGTVETRQSKKPFIDPMYDAFFDNCNNPLTGAKDKLPADSEACLGTRDYCTLKKYEAMGERFDSPKACIDSRQPPLFKEPASAENQEEFCVGNGKFGGDAWRAKSEPCLGTVEYCNKKHYEGTAETYDNSDQCIAVRQKSKPGSGSGTAELPAETELATEGARNETSEIESMCQPLLTEIKKLPKAEIQQKLINALTQCKISIGGPPLYTLYTIECPNVEDRFM